MIFTSYLTIIIIHHHILIIYIALITITITITIRVARKKNIFFKLKIFQPNFARISSYV